MTKLVIACIGIIISGLQVKAADTLLAPAASLIPIDKSVRKLQTEEAARTRAIQYNEVTEPAHTYGIFRRLNKIRTTGPVANEAERKIIVQSVIGNALRVRNFDFLTQFYLVESTNLASRLAYLAISLLTHDQRLRSASDKPETPLEKAARLMETIDNDENFSRLKLKFGEKKTALESFRRHLVTYHDLVKSQYGEVYRHIGQYMTMATKGKGDKTGSHRAHKPRHSSYPEFYSRIVKKLEASTKRGANSTFAFENFKQQVTADYHLLHCAEPSRDPDYFERLAIDNLEVLIKYCFEKSLLAEDGIDLIGVFVIEESQAPNHWHYLKNWRASPARWDYLKKWGVSQAPTSTKTPIALQTAPAKVPTRAASMALQPPPPFNPAFEEGKLNAQTQEQIAARARAIVSHLNELEQSAPKVVQAFSQGAGAVNAALAEQSRLKRACADEYGMLKSLTNDQGKPLSQSQILALLFTNLELAKKKAVFYEAAGIKTT